MRKYLVEKVWKIKGKKSPDICIYLGCFEIGKNLYEKKENENEFVRYIFLWNKLYVNAFYDWKLMLMLFLSDFQSSHIKKDVSWTKFNIWWKSGKWNETAL